MTVVVGFIPTPVGYAALDAARDEAGRRGGPLIVVNVVRDGDDEDPRHARPEQLDLVQDRLRGAPVRIDVRQVRAEGGIAGILLDVAETEQADLLVVGIRRGREDARQFLGVTAQKLLVDAACDVLVV